MTSHSQVEKLPWQISVSRDCESAAKSERGDSDQAEAAADEDQEGNGGGSAQGGRTPDFSGEPQKSAGAGEARGRASQGGAGQLHSQDRNLEATGTLGVALLGLRWQ